MSKASPQFLNISWSHAWAKAGVMIRASLSPSSAYAFMLVTPDGRRAFQNRRFSSSAACLSAHSNIEAISLPFWVKLQRQGDRLTGYYSQDGVSWIRQSDTEYAGADASPNPQTISMPARVYVGLALTSHVSGRAATAILFRREDYWQRHWFLASGGHRGRSSGQ